MPHLTGIAATQARRASDRDSIHDPRRCWYSSSADSLQSVLFSSSCNSILWQIRQLRDNMQRFAILSAFATAVAFWLAMNQQRLVAFQSETQAQQQVETANPAEGDPAAPVAESAASPAGDAEAVPAAAAEPAPDPAVVAAAEKLLRDARDRLYSVEREKGIRAKFVEQASIGNRQFVAEGTYLQGPFPSLRMEYRVQIGGSEGVLVEVCDGNVLRTSKEVRPIGSKNAEPTLSQWTRKDINQILEASYVEGTPDQAILQAELSLGGIPTLLASLERTMLFDTVREQQWKGKPMTVIEGGWRPEQLSKVAAQMGASAQSVASFVPDRVRIYFDKETLFPTRILYRKLVSLQPRRYAPLMSIEFSDVVLNAPVDAGEFRSFRPKGVDEVDETQLYLSMIKRMQQPVQPPAEPGAPIDATAPAGGGPAQQQPQPGAETPPAGTEGAPAKQ
jgi:hypothetical protein